MRILLLSDLHHELWRDSAPTINPAISQPDVVILAGDIDTGDKAVAWANRTFCKIPILYIAGNHEAYGKNLEDVCGDIKVACLAAENVHFLQCGEFVLGNTRFLGTTLWTDFKLFGDDTRVAAMREAESMMNDYHRIRLAGAGYRKLRTSDTAKFHAVERNWLERKLDEVFDGRTVVITHMAPSKLSVPEIYASDGLSAAYASRLDSLVEKADVWVHGHIHESMDYHIGKCRVVCNPCGYKTGGGTPENEQFDPNFVIDL